MLQLIITNSNRVCTRPLSHQE